MYTNFSVDTNPENLRHVRPAAWCVVDKLIAPFILEVVMLQCNYFYHRIAYLDVPRSANET